MSDTLQKAKELALSQSLDEQAELGAILQESLSEHAVSEGEKERIASVIHERVNGPFVRVDDPAALREERLKKIRARLAAGQPATGEHGQAPLGASPRPDRYRRNRRLHRFIWGVSASR